MDDIFRSVRGNHDNAVPVANFQCRRVFDGVHHGKMSALVDHVVFRIFSNISIFIYWLTRISTKHLDNRREFAAITRCPRWQSSWSQAQRRAERIFPHNFSIPRGSVGHVLGYFSEATTNIVCSQIWITIRKKLIFEFNFSRFRPFAVIVAPVVKHLFVPITIIGCFGLSFQLSMLVDLLNIITLHAHCIYIYVSM